MKTVLFQGDSITDCSRSREIFSDIGKGYPLLVKSKLGYENPNKFDFQNRAIAGNRIVDVYARIKADNINLKPDYMSMLIGVNDVWHDFLSCNGVDPDKFEKIYSMMIEEITEAVPGIKIMILEPFCLRGSNTDNTEEFPDKWEKFKSGVEENARRSKKVAEKYNLTFIPLQHLFDKAAQEAENSYWLGDGVHPTAMGHEIISREWIKFFSQF